MDCEFCVAHTKKGSLCKRPALCKKGCKYFCWQHTRTYGGKYNKKVCNDPAMDGCEVCEDGNTYPCTVGYHSVFFSEAEMKEYCDLIGQPYYDPEAMRELARKKTKEWKGMKIPKKKTKTKVQFK